MHTKNINGIKFYFVFIVILHFIICLVPYAVNITHSSNNFLYFNVMASQWLFFLQTSIQSMLHVGVLLIKYLL